MYTPIDDGRVIFQLGINIYAYVYVHAWNTCYVEVQGEGDMFEHADDFIYIKNGKVVMGMDFSLWNTVRETASDELVIPDGITSIADEFMYIWSDYVGTLTKLVIGKDVERIGNSAFESRVGFSDLTEIICLSDKVWSIGSRAFYSVSKVKFIDFRGKPTSVGSSAFENCHALEWVRLSNDIEMLNPSTFNNCYVLRWFNQANIIKHISESCFWNGVFRNCNSLKVLTIYDSAEFPIVQVGTNIAGVELYAGKECDENGYMITTIRTNNPQAVLRNWQGLDNRTPIIEYIHDYFCVAHQGKWLRFKLCLGLEDKAKIDIFHNGAWHSLKLHEDNNNGKRAVSIAYCGKWYWLEAEEEI